MGGSQNPQSVITAKPARAVNALAGFAAIVMVGFRYAYIRRGRRRFPARRAVVRSDVRRADAEAPRRSAADTAAPDFFLLPPPHTLSPPHESPLRPAYRAAP